MINLGKILEVKNAKIKSYIFVDTYTEKQVLSHNWEVRVNFHPVEVNNLNLQCFISCQNLELNFRDWRKINKTKISLDVQPNAEWAFYSGEFDYIDCIDGELTYIRDNIFNITLSFKVIIKDLFAEYVEIEKSIEVEAEYEGVVMPISRFNLDTTNIDECLDVVNKVVDISLYSKEPELIYKSDYLFRAKKYFK